MEIVRPDKDSGLGIYAESIVVKPKEHLDVAAEMIEWFDKANGSFKGEFARGFAIAHCQVANIKEPLKLIVLEKDLVKPDAPKTGGKGAQTLENVFFEAQTIWNAEILESPKKITRKVPKRTVSEPLNGKVDVDIEWEDKELNNQITVPEACMSFQHRGSKNIKRYHTIKVRYQYIGKGLLGGAKVKTFEGWVKGLKAHVLQHECQHFEGKNMYYD